MKHKRIATDALSTEQMRELNESEVAAISGGAVAVGASSSGDTGSAYANSSTGATGAGALNETVILISGTAIQQFNHVVSTAGGPSAGVSVGLP